jgi:hypothetical protein
MYICSPSQKKDILYEKRPAGCCLIVSTVDTPLYSKLTLWLKLQAFNLLWQFPLQNCTVDKVWTQLFKTCNPKKSHCRLNLITHYLRLSAVMSLKFTGLWPTLYNPHYPFCSISSQPIHEWAAKRDRGRSEA